MENHEFTAYALQSILLRSANPHGMFSVEGAWFIIIASKLSSYMYSCLQIHTPIFFIKFKLKICGVFCQNVSETHYYSLPTLEIQLKGWPFKFTVLIAGSKKKKKKKKKKTKKKDNFGEKKHFFHYYSS